MAAVLPTALLTACGTVAAPAKAPVAVEATPVQVYAAGSLRDAFTEVARDYHYRTGQAIALILGPSGLLRERIERGEPAQVFASADTDHPQRLADKGGWQPRVVFTRNALCALTTEKFSLTPDSLLPTLLRKEVRVGASTPQNLFTISQGIALERNREEWMLRVRRMGACPCQQSEHSITRFRSNPQGSGLGGWSAALRRLPIASYWRRTLPCIPSRQGRCATPGRSSTRS